MGGVDGWIYPDISAVSVSAYMSVEYIIAISPTKSHRPMKVCSQHSLVINYVILRGNERMQHQMIQAGQILGGSKISLVGG